MQICLNCLIRYSVGSLLWHASSSGIICVHLKQQLHVFHLPWLSAPAWQCTLMAVPASPDWCWHSPHIWVHPPFLHAAPQVEFIQQAYDQVTGGAPLNTVLELG
jgi:hypothetical protein